MYKYLTAMFMCLGISSYAQDSIDMIKILNIEREIVALENRITNSIKINNPEIARIQGLRQFHVFWLFLDCENLEKADYIEKADYLDISFLYQLRCTYYNLSPKVKKNKWSCKHSILYRISPSLYYHIRSKRWKEYLKGETLITDSVGNLVARGDAIYVNSFSKNSYTALSKMALSKMFFNKEIDFVFFLHRRDLSYLIGIKGNKLYVIKETKEGLKIYTWEEFMECCLEEWEWERRVKKQNE